MFSLKLRWLAAGIFAVAALVAAPARSNADFSVLVQEIDSGGNAVGAPLLFNGVGNNYNTGSGSTPSFEIGNINPFMSNNGTFGSLTTTFNLAIGQGFVQADGHALQLTINATGFSNNLPGGPGSFTNNAGVSSGIFGTGGSTNIAGINQVTANTTVEGVTSPDSVASAGDTLSQGAPTLGNVAALPHPYSIVQTIIIRALPVNANAVIATGATFGGSASSTVTASAVPAPGGLALALIALPVIGARRVFRRKPTA